MAYSRKRRGVRRRLISYKRCTVRLETRRTRLTTIESRNSWSRFYGERDSFD